MTTTPQHAIGIDIGGTKISSAVVPSTFTHGDSLDRILKAATPDNAMIFLDTLTDMVKELVETHANTPVQAVGISTAGTVDNRTGTILGSTANVPFLMEIANLAERLRERTGLPVTVENDANAAAYAEYKVGAGRGQDPVMMVTLGTGVGGGLVIDGSIYSGRRYFAMEVGHICIEKERRRQCTCGRWGCWEAFASGNGLRKTIHEFLLNDPQAKGSALFNLGKDIDSVGNHDLVAAWENGDKPAQLIMDIWHQDIATGLGSVINVLDPEVVVVGGGLCKFVDFEKLAELTRERCMLGGTPIVRATLDNESGIVGAACLAIEKLNTDHKTATSV